MVQTYSASEVGWPARACGEPAECDEHHLLTDSLALIQHRREHRGTVVDPFLFTSLHPLARKVLISMETDDTGVVETRACGCLLEQIGLTTHVHHIRSFGKLTTNGMTVLGSDLLRLVEEVLPARFGGSALDYQFVEEDAPGGVMRLSLLIAPEAGEIDGAAVVDAVLAELRRGRPSYQLAAEVWRQAEGLRVERRHPIATGRGKVLPLYIASLPSPLTLSQRERGWS